MKKPIVAVAAILVAVVVTGAVFKDPLRAWLEDVVAEDMFVDSDSDSYDPGLAVGDSFPPIHALYQGREISSIDPFILDKGLVFIAVRSADW